MRKLIFSALVCAIVAKPEGYFKQEYQFQKSSSTYKNNQLQTQDNDQGFYKKQGDLDGTSAPRVDQHNEHNEFISPQVDGKGHSITTYNDRDLTMEAERAFQNHGLQPSSGDAFYKKPAYNTGTLNNGQAESSSYSFSTKTRNAYSSQSSSLQSLCQNVQRNAARNLEEALNNMPTYNQDFRGIESDLKANLTRDFNSALYKQYGTSGTYDSSEFDTLRRLTEQNLLKQLHSSSQYTASSSASSQTFVSRREPLEVEDLNSQHTYLQQPSITYNQRPRTQPARTYQYPVNYNSGYSSHSGYQSSSQHQNSYAENFPPLNSQPTERIVIQPEISITNIAQNVQNKLANQVNTAIAAYESKYNSESHLLTDTRPNLQATLNDYKQDLKYNISKLFNDEIFRKFGNQVQRNEYMFSNSYTTVANYRVDDYDRLKQDIETNLVKLLEDGLTAQENRFVNQRRQQTNSYRNYNHHGPSQTHILTSDNQQMPSGLNQVRNEMQHYVASQVQSNSRVTQSDFQTILEEMKRNLTRKLDEAMKQHNQQGGRQGYSYSASAGSLINSNYSPQELNSLTQQLQNDLLRQLNEQMRNNQYSESSSSSSSSSSQYSSGSGNYRSGNSYNSGIKSGAFQKYGSFEQNQRIEAEPCLFRNKRDLYGQELEDLSLELKQLEAQIEKKFVSPNGKNYEGQISTKQSEEDSSSSSDSAEFQPKGYARTHQTHFQSSTFTHHHQSSLPSTYTPYPQPKLHYNKYVDYEKRIHDSRLKFDESIRQQELARQKFFETKAEPPNSYFQAHNYQNIYGWAPKFLEHTIPPNSGFDAQDDRTANGKHQSISCSGTPNSFTTVTNTKPQQYEDSLESLLQTGQQVDNTQQVVDDFGDTQQLQNNFNAFENGNLGQHSDFENLQSQKLHQHAFDQYPSTSLSSSLEQQIDDANTHILNHDPSYLSQQIEDDLRSGGSRTELGQETVNFGRQSMKDDFGTLQIGSQNSADPIKPTRTSQLGQDIDDTDTQQVEEIFAQQPDYLDEHTRSFQGQLEDDVLVQAIDDSNTQISDYNDHPKIQLGQQIININSQQVEDNFRQQPDLQQGYTNSQQFVDDFDDLILDNQQIDHSNSQKVESGFEQSIDHVILGNDNQQIEDGFSKLLPGQQIDESNTQHIESGPEQSVNQEILGQEVDGIGTLQIDHSNSQQVESSFGQSINQVILGNDNQQTEDGSSKLLPGQQTDEYNTQQIESGFKQSDNQDILGQEVDDIGKLHIGQQPDDNDDILTLTTLKPNITKPKLSHFEQWQLDNAHLLSGSTQKPITLITKKTQTPQAALPKQSDAKLQIDDNKDNKLVALQKPISLSSQKYDDLSTQHKQLGKDVILESPLENDFTINSQQNINMNQKPNSDTENKDTGLIFPKLNNQEEYIDNMQFPEPDQFNFDYIDQTQQLENVQVPQSINLADLHRSYINRKQHASAGSQLNQPNVQFNTYSSNIGGIEEKSSYHSLTNPSSERTFSITAPNQQLHYGSKYISSSSEKSSYDSPLVKYTQFEQITETIFVHEMNENPSDTYSFESNDGDTTTQKIITEITTPVEEVGFWKKMGGKISNGFNSAKKKAKSLFE